MQVFSFSQTVLYFSLYSIIGWLCETVSCSIHAGKFVNRGFLSGPYCPVYGFGALFVLTFATPLAANPLLVFLVSLVITTLLEYFTGWLLETLFQTKWWDYSNKKLNLNGRICLQNALIFGAMGLAAVYLFHPQAEKLIGLIVPEAQRLLVSLIIALLILDFMHTLSIVNRLQERLKNFHNYLAELEHYNKIYAWYDKRNLSASIDRLREICRRDPANENNAAVLARIEQFTAFKDKSHRILKAFPTMEIKNLRVETKMLRKKWTRRKFGLSVKLSVPEGARTPWYARTPRLERTVWRVNQTAKRFRQKTGAAFKGLRSSLSSFFSSFKQPISLYKFVWVFFVGCIIGYLIETVFCLVTTGTIESRQGMIYGPFSQIYGFGAVLLALLLHPFAKKGDRWLFFGGALIGGAFEWVASFVQELAFGTVSWDYSHHPFSFCGRTSLLYMFFWGILSVLYMKHIYPRLSNLIERIPKRQGVFFAWVLAIGLGIDMLLSAAAVVRWTDRSNGKAAANAYEQYFDEHYPDEMLKAIYPNMQVVEQQKP